MSRLPIALLVFLSGFAGLVYEVLWMKQLGLLFGNTSHAAAATLAAFFAGLAVGSWSWGRRSPTMKNPLRAYAWLQVGIAFTALAYFVILACYYAIYPPLYQAVPSRTGLLAIKFALALALVFPPAFCMGGTIPVIGQYVIRQRATFGMTSAFLYGVNTFGAALGAFLAGFYFPLWLGYRATFSGAILLSLLVAAAAFVLARNGGRQTLDRGSSSSDDIELTGVTKQKDTPKGRRIDSGQFSQVDEAGPHALRWTVPFVCFLSGFGILALEVLWTRMFAQVLENSVYTFAAVLVIVLICLAAGALVSSCLARVHVPPVHLLAVLMLLGATATAIMPFVLMQLTNSLQILVSAGSWAEYVLLIFRTGFLVFGPPAFLLGTVFPYMMKVEERRCLSAGRSLGMLAAVNTCGAIAGSLLCGFVLLGWLGMWRTTLVIAVVYPASILLLPLGWRAAGIAVRIPAAILIVLLFTVLNPSSLPITSVDQMRHHEEIVETWEGSDCTVAVSRDKYGLAIKINSHYSLGSTGAFVLEKLQADLPLMIWPQTESIFFLGMGTGITAGSALDPQFDNIKRIVACELVPEVVEAARKYVTDFDGFDYTGGLFTDPRATVVVEDGRHFLMATSERFDMINADLFVPFRSGAGNLYTKEHFRSARQKLNPGGVFVQWVPLYQVTENEFGIIARTMLEEFEQVSLWRNNFQPGEEVVAFVGHSDMTPLPASGIDSQADKRAAVEGKTYYDLQNLALPFNTQTITLFYCGNLTVARELFEEYPLNTDDKPLIEYMAPRTYRRKGRSVYPWFVGPRILAIVQKILRLSPPESDPLLVNRTPANQRLPAAGLAFHRARIAEIMRDEEACRNAWNRFVREYTNQ